MLLISNTHVYTQDFFSHCSLVAIGPYLQDTQGPSRLEFDRLTSLNCVGGEGGGASVNLGEKISWFSVDLDQFRTGQIMVLWCGQ